MSSVVNTIVGKSDKGVETIIGTDGDDYIRPLGGSDFIDGQKGFDTVYVFWPSSKFNISTLQGTTYLDAVSGASKNDQLKLRNIEAIEFSDKVVSLEIPDVYKNTTGFDNFDGGPGLDTVEYEGNLIDYSVISKYDGLAVSLKNSSEASDWFKSIERLQFKDKGLAFDLDGNAGVAAKTLGLVFGADAVALPNYVGICLDLLERQNYTQNLLMKAALNVRLGADASDPGKVVDFLFVQLTGAVPNAQDKASFVNLIVNQTYSIESLAVAASELSLNPVAPALVGLATTGLSFSMPT